MGAELIPKRIDVAASFALALSLAACATPQEEAALTAEDRALIDAMFDLQPGDPPGIAVMVARGDQLLFCEGYGIADVETGAPVDCDTVFRIGSVSKQVTATAALQLVEAGTIRLDDPITEYLPQVPDMRSGITVRHLLTHRSGLPGYDQIAENAPAMSVTDADVVDYVANANTAYFLPGEGWGYSNTGYAVLAEVVAAASGEPYGDYVDRHIFGPAGMIHSTLHADAVDPEQRAYGHAFIGGDYVRRDQGASSAVMGDGSVHTSARDWFDWHRAWLSGALLGEELQRETMTAQAGTDGIYGFGWFPVGGDHPYVRHGGGTAGFMAFTARLPEEEITVAIFANLQPTGTDEDYNLRLRSEVLMSLASNGNFPLPADWETVLGQPDGNSGED